MTPDRSKTYLVSISGGKDSTAMWLYLRNTLALPNLVPMFADTGWEHSKTYAYLDYLESSLGPLVRLPSPYSMVSLAIKKKRFPSARARFCTTVLKMVPARNWIQTEIACGRLDAGNLIMCSGVRAEESAARSKMAEWVETDDFYKLPQWRPIISWTWQQVFAIHDHYGIEPNPLYKDGMGRVGCMPCIMANNAELAEIGRRFPEVVEKVALAEDEVAAAIGHASSFFAMDTIPDRFCSLTHSGKDGTATKVPTAKDVFDYVQLEKPEKNFGGKLPRLFEEPENEDLGSCSSIYGLCE